LTRDEAEDFARQDAAEGLSRAVPDHAEAWYQTARAEEVDRIFRARRADLRRRGIVVPWWEVYP
jgi:hypothetical protein